MSTFFITQWQQEHLRALPADGEVFPIGKPTGNAHIKNARWSTVGFQICKSNVRP